MAQVWVCAWCFAPRDFGYGSKRCCFCYRTCLKHHVALRVHYSFYEWLIYMGDSLMKFKKARHCEVVNYIKLKNDIWSYLGELVVVFWTVVE